MWWLRTTLVIALVACSGILSFRIWYWADNCIFNKTYVYPPVYQCGVHPFDFTDNYIDMRIHNREMSERVEADASAGNYPLIHKD